MDALIAQLVRLPHLLLGRLRWEPPVEPGEALDWLTIYDRSRPADTLSGGSWRRSRRLMRQGGYIR